METLHNIPYAEIQPGASASLVHRVSRTDIDALALVAGDIDAFHIAEDGSQGGGEIQVESIGAGALLSGLLNRRLPGPGTSIVEQNLRFAGNVQVGDELEASVTVRDKQPAQQRVVFDCRVHCGGQDLVTGTVTVRAPERSLHYSDIATPEIILRRADKYARLLQNCAGLAPVRCAVVHPCDRDALRGAIEAAQRGLIEPVLVGPEAKIRATAQTENIDLAPYRLITTEHSHAAADTAVDLARTGEVEALMKGSLHTDELMAAVVRSATGLRTARRISHAFVLDVPTYPRALLITDAAINIAPSLTDKIDIVQNAIDLAHALGCTQPRVAILSAMETVNPNIPSTLDAAALCKMAERGQISGGILDGPLAFDNAISEEAARIKKIVSPVAGKADILVAPDLEAGNMIAKQLSYLAGADSAGIVLGTRVPIVLTSRADNVRTRLASAAVMKLVAHARRNTAPAVV